MADPQPTGVTTEELLSQLLEEQRAHRQELADLRAQVDKGRAPAPSQTHAAPVSAEEALAQRMAVLSEHEYYCPGCGAVGDYPQKCIGRGEAPHHATEMVPTTEVTEGDASQHTAAPYVTGEGNLVVP